MVSLKRKGPLGFIQLLVCEIIYSWKCSYMGWRRLLRMWIQCALHSRALYCQPGSSWITIAPNLIINILTLSHTHKKSPSPRTVLQRMTSLCNKGLYCTLNEGLRIFELLECYMWFFSMWRIENENTTPYSEEKENKTKWKRTTSKESFQICFLCPRVRLFSMACFPGLWPTRWAFHSFPLKMNIAVQQVLVF